MYFGTPEGIRTPDLLVRSQTLYPAELLAHFAVLSTDCLYIISRFPFEVKKFLSFFSNIFIALKKGAQPFAALPF